MELGLSDHSRFLVKIKDDDSVGRMLYMFFSCMTEYELFLKVVGDASHSHYRGTDMYKMCGKLKNVRGASRSFIMITARV